MIAKDYKVYLFGKYVVVQFFDKKQSDSLKYVSYILVQWMKDYNIMFKQRVDNKAFQLFNAVISQFQSANQYEKFIKQSTKQYDVKIYKLNEFTLAHARSVYQDLSEKYQEKKLEVLGQGWHENQRRLYVWFIVCFIHLKLVDLVKLVDGCDKYWRMISETFWGKQVYFLKYQLLTLMKTRGRTVWKPQEDILLKKIINKHPKGEWNEVAKQFYKLSDGKYFKTPKQSRQRWQNHLNEDIKKGEWKIEEDITIFSFIRQKKQMNQKKQKKWAKIIPLLKNARTEHMIKNRFKSLTKKIMQDQGKTQAQAIEIVYKNLKDQSKNKFQEAIQFVQSEEIIDQQKQEEEINLKRSTKYEKKTEKFSIKNDSIKSNNSVGKKSNNSLGMKSNNSFGRLQLDKKTRKDNNLFDLMEQNAANNCGRLQSFLGGKKQQISIDQSFRNAIPVLFYSSSNFPSTPINLPFSEDRSYHPELPSLYYDRNIFQNQDRPSQIFLDSGIYRRSMKRDGDSYISNFMKASNEHNFKL